MVGAVNSLILAVVIVLLIIDIIGRLNSTYWFRKGFDAAQKIILEVMTSSALKDNK